jgi:hypothetical protein
VAEYYGRRGLKIKNYWIVSWAGGEFDDIVDVVEEEDELYRYRNDESYEIQYFGKHVKND